MYVRGQERMVTQQTFDTMRDTLYGPLGWDGLLLGRLPFQATVKPTILEDSTSSNKIKTDVQVKNTIGFSEGQMPPDDSLELGDGLQEQVHTYFVDIYGESLSIARQLAHDVRGIFTDRHGRSCVELLDYSQDGHPVMVGHLVFYEDVETEYPETLSERDWAVVKITARHQFNP